MSVKNTVHQIAVGTIAAVLALLIWWVVEPRLPEQIPTEIPLQD